MNRFELEKAYREAEASCQLEGMDPTGDPVYMAARTRVLAGEMTPEEMMGQMVRFSQQQAENARTVVRRDSAA